MQHLQPHDFVGRSIPRSTFYDSPFGRMFGRLAPWVPPGADDAAKEDGLLQFAHDNMVEADGAVGVDNDKIPAGYTYFGQFVDHDITFDPTSSTTRLNDPNKLKNFRTPRFDLDSVYCAGPEASPFMYDGSSYGMLLEGIGVDSREADLPRNDAGTALIGDPRNDENIIVAQLQLAFIKLHNRVLTEIRNGAAGGDDVAQFHEAQRIVRWFYQYVVWNDFVKRLVHDDLHSQALRKIVETAASSKDTEVWRARRRFYTWKQSPYIPVEFSTAAYRFGHSMVRPDYEVNHPGLGFGTKLPIFSPLDPTTGHRTAADLRGGRRLPAGHSIQWDWFFDMATSGGPFPQPSRDIDTRLSSAMSQIPMGPGRTVPLAFLNLRRGWRMELPSGPDVATFLGLDETERVDVAPGTAEECLWFYILAEGKELGGMSGKMLGPVGGTIIAEVFAGLLDGDPLSYVNFDPLWNPGKEAVLRALGAGDTESDTQDGTAWTVGDIINAAGIDGSGADIPSLSIDLNDPALLEL